MSRLGAIRFSSLGVAALALAGLAVGGCHTYKYVQSSVTFNQTVDDSDIMILHHCRIVVTGADSDSFLLNACPPAVTTAAPDPHVGPRFEFSTFAESGTLHFEFQGLQGLADQCKLLSGTLDVPVTSMTTIMAPTIDVTKTGTNCANNVSPTTDGGP
jgi:hypothetical protein